MFGVQGRGVLKRASASLMVFLTGCLFRLEAFHKDF